MRKNLRIKKIASAKNYIEVDKEVSDTQKIVIIVETKKTELWINKIKLYSFKGSKVDTNIY